MNLAELRRLLAAATPGPWKSEPCCQKPGHDSPDWGRHLAGPRRVHPGFFHCDAEAIVALRNNAEALLAVVDAAMDLHDHYAVPGKDRVERLVALRAALAPFRTPEAT